MLAHILKQLEKYYGQPKPPAVTDPFEMILFGNVAYLVSDDRRAAAFAALKKRVGTRPQKILDASDEILVDIVRVGGMLPEVRAKRLRHIAEIAHWIFKDDLRPCLKKSLSQARKDLKKFPSIGDPGAEKILLFTRSHPVLSLDSNALRVLLRLGFGQEMKNYSASYRSAQAAAEGQLPKDFDPLISAYQLLRLHGQQLCRRAQPLCARCPIRNDCPYFQDRFALPTA